MAEKKKRKGRTISETTRATELEREKQSGFLTGDKFINGVPITYCPTDYFVYFNSLRTSKFWASKRLGSFALKSLAASLSHIAVGDRNARTGMGSTFEIAFNFLGNARDIERAREIQTIQTLRDVIKARYAKLSNAPGIDAKRVQQAQADVDRYLAKFDESLKNGNFMNFEPEYLIGLFDALRQNTLVFTSGIKNDSGRYTKETYDKQTEIKQNMEAQGRTSKGTVVADDVASKSQNAAAHSRDAANKAFPQIMNYLTNNLYGSVDNVTDNGGGVAEIIANKLIEFLGSEEAQTQILSKFVQEGDLNIQKLMGFCWLVVHEWFDRIAASIKFDGTAKFELSASEVKKILNNENFLKEYMTGDSALVKTARTGSKDDVDTIIDIISEVTKSTKIKESTYYKKRQGEVDSAAATGRRPTVQGKNNTTLVLNQTASKLATVLMQSKQQMFVTLGQEVRGLSTSKDVEKIVEWSTGDNQTQAMLMGKLEELLVQLGAHELNGVAEGVSATSSQYGGFSNGVDTVTIIQKDIDVNTREMVTKLKAAQLKAQKSMQTNARTKISQIMEKAEEDVKQAFIKGTYTTTAIAKSTEELTRIQNQLKEDVQKAFADNGPLSVTTYFEFDESVKQYFTMEMGATENNLKSKKIGTAYTGRSLQLKNFAAMFKTIANMAGLEFNADAVISLLLNSHDGTVFTGANAAGTSGVQHYILSDYLSMFVNIMMFDDYGLMAQQYASKAAQMGEKGTSTVDMKNYTKLHLYVLNGHYVPVSFVLTVLYNDLKELEKQYKNGANYDKARKKRQNTATIHIEGMNMQKLYAIEQKARSEATEEYTSKTEKKGLKRTQDAIETYSAAWGEVSEEALGMITIKMKFLQDFGRFTEELFKSRQF